MTVRPVDITAGELRRGDRTDRGKVRAVTPPAEPGLPIEVTFEGTTATAFWPDMPIRVLRRSDGQGQAS